MVRIDRPTWRWIFPTEGEQVRGRGKRAEVEWESSTDTIAKWENWTQRRRQIRKSSALEALSCPMEDQFMVAEKVRRKKKWRASTERDCWWWWWSGWMKLLWHGAGLGHAKGTACALLIGHKLTAVGCYYTGPTNWNPCPWFRIRRRKNGPSGRQLAICALRVGECASYAKNFLLHN